MKMCAPCWSNIWPAKGLEAVPFADLITAMTAAAAAGRGHDVAACFTPDGVYHDVFYGDFQGPAAIADLIENHFHRDAEAFPDQPEKRIKKLKRRIDKDKGKRRQPSNPGLPPPA